MSDLRRPWVMATLGLLFLTSFLIGNCVGLYYQAKQVVDQGSIIDSQKAEILELRRLYRLHKKRHIFHHSIPGCGHD